MNATAAYFADTSFWIALSHKSDQYHGRASIWSRHLIQEDAFILTTEAVLWEWMNALADSGKRRTTAEGYRKCHQDPRIEVVPFAADTIAGSLTDCLSFLTMEKRRVPRALTTDRHFQQASFEAVLLGDPPGSG